MFAANHSRLLACSQQASCPMGLGGQEVVPVASSFVILWAAENGRAKEKSIGELRRKQLVSGGFVGKLQADRIPS